ncbi:MAG: hypothetical protein FJY95_18220 [Candidatus Handelsmanbacteria bacterium]|nr:hypothetical protein [Candidatus Handelsmanbacteria bacterium]
MPVKTVAPHLVETLVERHQQFLGFLEKRVGDRAAAEDLLQAAYLKSMEREGQLRDQESAVAWFYRLLRNAVVDHYRRKGAEADFRTLFSRAYRGSRAFGPS